MVKVIGIVSSFRVKCGNATYSEHLLEGIKKLGYTVKEIALPMSLQHGFEVKGTLDEIARQIKECDIINFQIELGLYGPSPIKSVNNIVYLYNVAKKNTDFVTCAIHRVERIEHSWFRLFVRNFMISPRKGFKITIKFIKKAIILRIFRKLFRKICSADRLIVHVERDKAMLTRYGCLSNKIFVHPIMWPSALLPKKKEYKESSQFSVGLFGFVSSYKNFGIIISAFSKLLEQKRIPQDSTLFICGGTHPEYYTYAQQVDSSPIDHKKIMRRSDFISEAQYLDYMIDYHGMSENIECHCDLSDEQLAQRVAAVDLVVIPYAETGQSGSGIASQAIQFGKRILMSDTHTTTEHDKLCDGQIVKFDVHSVYSAMSGILRAKEQVKPVRFKEQYNYDTILDLMLDRSVDCET